MIGEVRHFRFWCQKVLPLVYDNSLSYYEVLCKVVKYINDLINSDKEIIKDIDGLKADMIEVQKWIDNFDKNAEAMFRQMIEEYIATMVFFGLTDDGYFVAYIPENWDDITFNTTGLDIDIPIQPDYGHLVLSY